MRENKDKPFFCYLPHYAVHTPLQAPPELVEKYRKRGHPRIDPVYAAMVERVDQGLGRMLDALDALGLAENTVVIIASDNGALADIADNRPFRAGKGHLYEGGIRVPFIARWPGRVPAGTTADWPCYFPDVLPTCCDLAAVQMPEGRDGTSLVPLLSGAAPPAEPRHLYWEWPTYDWGKQKYTGLIQAVRHGDWKLLRQGEDLPWELYDLANDPGEQNNIAAEHPERVTELRQWVDANRRPMPPQVEPEMPEGKKFR